MKDTTSQVISLASVLLISFIPNDILRDIMFALAPLAYVVHLVHENTPNRRFERLEVSATDLKTLLATAVAECFRDPLFVHEMSLELAEVNLKLSTLRAKAISRKDISWKECPYHLITIIRAIDECQRDMDDLRSSILVSVVTVPPNHLTITTACARTCTPAEVNGGYRP
ncbi:hypothetical protein C8R46DRAFT_665788 [Mycena filopes]|nr:hypothetical protein C8R46DRAFT_665788 [Mycena filopes]